MVSLLLRFRHPTKNLDYLSSMLSMPCLTSWIAGTQRKTPKGKVLPGLYSKSYWVSQLNFSCDSKYQDKIIYILDKLLNNKENIIEIKKTGGEIELYLQLPGSINNGCTIKSELVKKMADLGIDLLIEVFPDQ